MSTYFSIGEIAKMFNISTQTLRLYDKIGLLNPAYINEESGYRYYSIDQFFKLDSIKQCKTMGLSLKKINELIGNDSSINGMLEITRKQKFNIESKIKEFEHMRVHLNEFEKRIKESIKIGFNNIVLIDNKERAFIKYNYTSYTQEELEMNLRKVILDSEEKYGVSNSQIGFTIFYDDIVNNNIIIYKEILIHLSDIELTGFKESRNENIVFMQKGTYLTIYIEDSSFDNRKYLNKMIEFAKCNNIEIVGDFIETSIITRLNKDGKENNLAKIEILCK